MSSFEPHWALIVTWYKVTFFGTTANPPPVSSTLVMGRYIDTVSTSVSYCIVVVSIDVDKIKIL